MPHIHMIGHGHIDPVWLWRWQEGFEEIRATFRSALDRMLETDGFCFTASSACFYAWIKECDLEMFEEIRARVCEGRWEIAGGWWIEPDCNLPNGESIVRQGLYGQRFFQREFGKHATVGFNPDSFGHCGTFPQILQLQGMQHYVYMRPNPGHDGGEREYPDGTTFVWRAPENSEVIASVIQESYNSTDASPECLAYLKNCPHLNPGQKQVMGFFGVGNHGGGPTKRAIAGILEAQKNAEPRVEFSTLERYFAALELDHPKASLPIIADELQHHARGCYSAHAGIKQWMRQGEHALMNAERLAVLAEQKCALKYPKEALESAWKTLLFNQFHDILAGTSIESAYDDARDQLGAVRHTANTIINTAIQVMAQNMDTSAAGNSVVVFNPLPWPVKQCVTPSPLVKRTLGDSIEVRDPAGKPVPYQEALGPHVGSRTVCFLAEVPALGYAVYSVQTTEVPQQEVRNSSLLITEHSIENKWWRLELDPVEGCISRLYDKTNDVELLHKGGRLLCIDDPSDTWSHRVKRFDGAVSHFINARVDILENGPVRATLRVQSSHSKSEAQHYITLYADDPAIDLRFRLNWQEQYTMLKLGFETRLESPETTCEVAYGTQTRSANGEEEPMQQWINLTGKIGDKVYGFAVLNDSSYAYDCLDGHLRISCLRSPAYAHHDPDPYVAAEPFSIMDQGWHSFGFRLVPHAGDWRDAKLPRQAWAFNNPLLVHIESAHPGNWPNQQGNISCTADNILWTVLKPQEDSNALVLRGIETEGKETECTVQLLDHEFYLSFRAHEIKTVLLDTASNGITFSNVLEEPTGA